MMISRRAVLPAPLLAGMLLTGGAAQAAVNWRIVATADGPWRSKVIDLAPGQAKVVAPPRAPGELNDARYILEIG